MDVPTEHITFIGSTDPWISGDHATGLVCLSELPNGLATKQPVPSGPNVTEVTGDERANAVVRLGNVVTGGDQMALVMDFPAYEAPVDIYAAMQLPDGSLYVVDSDGNLTMDLVPYRTRVTDAQSATILDSFDVCKSFGASVPTGTWNVYAVVAPTNGGDFSGIDLTSGDYDLWFYSFDVTCP